MPKYQLEIGLKGDTIEHVKEIEARSLDEAYKIGSDWAIEEYCIVQATPVDDAGKLASELEDLVKSIGSAVRTMSRNMDGGLADPRRAERFLRAMEQSIGSAIKQAFEDVESDD